MTNDDGKEVKELIAKAAKVQSADEAMKLTQAAFNAANALCALATYRNLQTGK